METEPRSKGIRDLPFAMIEGVGDAEHSSLERERLPVGAVADDRLERLRHEYRPLGLLVEIVEQLAQLRLREEEAEVLVVAAVHGHADVVEHRGEHDDEPRSRRVSSGSR